MLLVLDNYEHLMEGADVAADILRRAPGVKALVTSRSRLNVTGEQLSPVRGMDVPPLPSLEDGRGAGGEGQYQAVQLFLSSAQRVRPGYQPTREDLLHVADICRLVEGMPLALLLAAAWMEMLTPAEIARELAPENGAQDPGRGIDFLEADLRDVPARQRSMRAVFDHSWTLLAQREQNVFAGLSVFRGGFTQEAAQHVTGASLRDLLVLVNRSLLYRTPAGRYEIHELLRQYAAERLAQSPDAVERARDRHAAFYAAALEQWATDLKGARQQAALAEIEADIENARASWLWAAGAGQTERLGQAIDGLGLFYEMHGPCLDGQVVCQTAANSLAATASGNGLRIAAKILAWQSAFSRLLGQTETAGQLLRQSLSTLERAEGLDQDTRPERAFTLSQMGEHLFDSDPETARLSYTQSLALYRSLDNHWGIARALTGLGLIAMNAGDHDQAQKLEQESLALARARGDRARMREPLQWLAYIAVGTGQWEEAERLGREYYAIYQEMGGPSSLAMGLTTFGAQLAELAKFAEARPMIEEGLAISEDLGWRRGMAWSNMYLGQIEMHQGLYKQARALEQTALTLFRELNRWGTTISLRLLGEIALAEGAYAEAQRWLHESAAISRELGRPDELCAALSALGCVAHRLGHTSEAQGHLRAALRIAVEKPVTSMLARVLSAVAPFLADQGMKEWAVELYALALLYPLAAISRWFEDVAGRYIAAVAATLPPEVVAAAQERGRARDLWATVEELLAELEEGS
jgi:predicted ATPase